MNQRALTERINSSSICDFESSSRLDTFALHLKQYNLSSLVEVLGTDMSVDRVGGWVWSRVWRHAQPRWLRRFALVRGPRGGMVGGWGSETPYKAATHLTDSLTCSYLHSLKPVLCCGHLVFRTPFRLSSLVWFWAKSFWNVRYRTRNNIVVSEQWMKCKKVFAYRASHQLLPLKLIYNM